MSVSLDCSFSQSESVTAGVRCINCAYTWKKLYARHFPHWFQSAYKSTEGGNRCTDARFSNTMHTIHVVFSVWLV